MLRELKRKGASIAAYGAPAKGNTLLNYCGIGTDLIDFISDRSPLKHGMYTPGQHIPVIEAEDLKQPDYTLLLAWNFADEIIKQQSVYLKRGGKFTIPIPTPEIISSSETKQFENVPL